MSSRQKKKAKTSSSPQASLSEPMQQAQQVLKFLQSKPDASPFLEPVDWELYGLTDYPEIITHPMDLGTVQVNNKKIYIEHKVYFSFVFDIENLFYLFLFLFIF
jgi:bromodomain-containing factor 1